MATKMTASCSTLGCNKPASLQCPKCIQLNLDPAHFCSQECFKKSWSLHKLTHTTESSVQIPLIEKVRLMVLPSRLTFKDFNSQVFFVHSSDSQGPIRPGIVSPRRTVPDHIQRPDYAETGDPLTERATRGSTSIDIKNADQIEAMRTVCRLAREVLDIGAAAAKPGVTTDEIDRIIHEAAIARNAYPSPLNYRGFPKSCCTSVNEVICHGIPDSRPLEDGDLLNIDVTLYYGGVHGDLNETYLIGNVDPKYKKLVDVTLESLEKAIAMVKPGALYRDVGNVISKVVNPHGFSVVRSYCGHGIGELFHTSPNVPHYSRNKAVGMMKAGHTFTIEPMINEGSWHDTIWPDDWSAVTKDGKRSAQFEHTLLVTETGCEVLTKRLDK